MRIRCVPCGSLSAEIGGHGARTARGKAHVVDHADPFPVRVLRLDVRSDGLNAGLVSGIHAGRGEVFDLAVHQQPERTAAIGFAEIEFEAVRFGKALEALQLEIAEVTVRQQIGQDVVAVIVPRSRGRTGIAAVDNLEWRIRRVAGEIFVGINVDRSRMIDRQQFYLIEINSFFQRLHEAEAELAVFLANRVAMNFDVFRRPRNVALVRPNPVADHARAQHVADQLVVRAIPDEKCGTGTAAAIDFQEVLFFQPGNSDFILQNAGGPEHAHDVGLLGLAEADDEVGRVLSEIAGRSGDFKFLAIRSGEDFDFGSDRALVVVQALERKPQPVVLVAAFIAQQHRRTVILRDEQIGGAVAVVVAGDDGARIFELNLVEADVGGDVFESIRAEIAEQTDFALAIGGFADSDEIDPAVVVVVEGGDAAGANPVGFGEFHWLESSCLDCCARA